MDGWMDGTWEWGVFAVSADEKTLLREIYLLWGKGGPHATRGLTQRFTTRVYTGVYTGVSPYRTRLARSLVAVNNLFV